MIEDYLLARLDENLEKTRRELGKPNLSVEQMNRLQAKERQLPIDFSRENWLSSAAQRASGVRLSTHVLKMTHPDAQGSSVFCPPTGLDELGALSTRSIYPKAVPDVVADAKLLDVFKFLLQVFEGETLLQRALNKDPSFIAAMSDDRQKAEGWCDAFLGISELDPIPSSHPLAKQVYWHHKGEQYTLLAPLTSSLLSSALLNRFDDERYSEDALTARDARKKGKPSLQAVRDFRGMVVQIVGGSNPQNISFLNSKRRCLNSKRGGANLLLPSLPPSWRETSVRLPRVIRSVFGRELLFQPGIRPLLKTLSGFLLSVQKRNNLAIRQKRTELTQALVDRTLEYGYRLQSQSPGWSAQSSLDMEECCWLDPGRRRTDPDFARQVATLNWRDEVCHRFGNWLNAQLSRAGLPVGDAEFSYWRDELSAEIRLMAEAMSPLPEETT